MTSIEKKYVYGEKNKTVLTARLLSKGKDGATWHSGALESITSCKKGDFCFNPDTFEIYKCFYGGNSNTAVWEFVCCLDPTGEIRQILAELNANPITKAWFGTREEYNAMTSDERNMYELHFIEEGT